VFVRSSGNLRFWALPMPKAAVRPLQPASRSFPRASPALLARAGKQKTVRKDRSKPLMFIRKFGAGEGIRTLDPNLGKVNLRTHLVRTAGLEPALSERNRFSYHFGFRRRQSAFVAWTVPSPWPLGRRRRPSSLYTFPQSRAWLGIGLGLEPVSVPRL
jgi:hypothetical protein